MAVEHNKNLGKFRFMGDDELGLIVSKIKDPNDRRSFSEVSKEWLRVEGLHRSSLCLLRPEYLRQVLPRFPNLVKFKTSMSITDSDLEFLAQTCPRLEVLNLDRSQYYAPNIDFVGSGLLAVAKGCPKLSKVSLHYRQSVSITAAVNHGFIDLASNLTHLDLSICSRVLDEVVEAIACSHSIIELNLAANNLITDRALGYLANGNCSKTLKTLILTRIYKLTDVGVSQLQKMYCLEHLTLTGLQKVTDISGVAISAITTLKKLCLEGLYKLSDSTIVALAQNCPNIEILDLTSCRGVTGAGIRSFSGHQWLEKISLPPKNVSGLDLDHLVLGCPSLKSIVVLDFPNLSLGQMQDSTKKLVEWRPNTIDIFNLGFF